jgi:bifunctional ADP-heptose synthase (sugar kinase/adenylyltransferase)
MSIQSIPDIFKAFQKLKVLVIGDVMIDAYIWGTVSRISPEAPVPVVNVKHREKRMGGRPMLPLIFSHWVRSQFYVL